MFAQVECFTYIVTYQLSYLYVLSNTRKLRLGNPQFEHALLVPKKIPTTSIHIYSVGAALIVLRSFNVLGR